MKRKYFSVLLMAAMTVASTSMVTSCKDYDDDINNVQTQIDAANDLIKKLDTQASTLQTAVTTAQSTADAAKTAAAEAATAAKNAQATGDKALAAAKTAEAAAEAAKAAAAEAQKAAIEAATKQVNDLKAEIQTALDNKVDVATFNTAVAKLEGDIAGIDAKLNTLGEDVKNNQKEITTAKEAIATLEAAQKNAEVQIAALEKFKATLESETIPGLNDAIKANGIEIEGVKKSVADLKDATTKAQEKLANDIAKVAADLTALQGTVDAIDAAYKAGDENLQNQIDDLLQTVKANSDKHHQDVSAIDAKITALDKLISDNKSELKNYTDDAVKAAKKDLQGQIDALAKLNIDGVEQGLADWMKQINDKFDNYYTSGQIDEKINTLTDNYKQAIADAIEEASENLTSSMNSIRTELLGEINLLNILCGQRLTSMVFAPTTYIDGIEAIKFSTLNYYDWGTDATAWEADAPTAKTYTYINDKETTVKYYLNPATVSLDAIENFDFVSQNATNEKKWTRAAEEAPIKVAGKSLKNGVLTLNVQKTGNAPLMSETSYGWGTTYSKFPIVALRAKLTGEAVTDKDDAANLFVYSDWARLYESTERPFIHNTQATDDAGNMIESNTDKKNPLASHFWSFSEAYDGMKKIDKLPTAENSNCITKKVDYNKSIDLTSLVEVCDKSGARYDLNKFGLKFEFHIMQYNLLNEGSTKDWTNQQYFAKLKEDGKTLVATARNGAEGNRDAIGRQPMIQVVLKDVNDPKHEKVVDVRYFKIQWVDVQETVDYGPIAKDFEDAYKCGETYQYIIGEEAMNNVYATANMSRDEFHKSYTVNQALFPSYNDVVNNTNSFEIEKTDFKDLRDYSAGGQTHNLKWTINSNYFAMTQAEYEAGEATRTVYGYFYKTSNPNSRIIFSMTVKWTINKMAYATGVNYSQEQWEPSGLTMANGLTNAGKKRFINPALRSDNVYGTVNYTDCQIIGDLKAGYINNGKVPATVQALVNFGIAKLTFDPARLSVLPTKKATDKWTLSNDNMELYYNGVQAATIDRAGIISLYEGVATKAGHNGEPTEGALLLVGKDVPVKLASVYCGVLNQEIDKYLVNFIKPLAMNEVKIEDTLKDVIDGGSSSVSIKNKIIIREAFGLKRMIVGPTNQLANDAKKLCEWYIVKPAYWDEANIKTNLQKNGSIGSSANVKLSDLRNADGSVKYRVAIDTNAQKVTFHNMSGNAISQKFIVSIPVSVQTKWGKFTQMVDITVVPNK